MTGRESWVTPFDRSLLTAVAQSGSVAGASRRLGVSRDRAVYRLSRLAHGLGHPVVAAVRGGRTPGGTALTTWGWRLLRRPESALLPRGRVPATAERSFVLSGRFSTSPEPRVESGGISWRVSFPAREGEWVRVSIDPEAVILSRRAFPSSARNRLRGTVERVAPEAPGVALVRIRVGRVRLGVAVTDEAVRELGLHAGSRVHLHIKATALHRVAERPTP